MAHKITKSYEATDLMQKKGVSIDTLASAIVRGKGYNMSDDKMQFIQEYAKVSAHLYDEFRLVFGRLFEETWMDE